MFPVTATPSSTSGSSTKRENNYGNFPMSTPLNQVYPPENRPNSPNTVPLSSATNYNVNNTVNTTTRTYKTRERLYYETDYVKASNSPVNNNNNSPNTGNAASSTLFEPFLRKQTNVEEVNTDELPPTASLHDFLSGSTPGGSSAINNNLASVQGQSQFSNLCTGSPMVINGVIGSPVKSSCVNSDLANSSIFVSGGPQQMTRSVTIFGFPPNCRNEILVSFQSHGPIETFDAASIENGGGSNWIHIVYETEWAAQKALSRNGTIFQPTGVMIGVIPMQTALERVNIAADSFMSPLKRSTVRSDILEVEQPSIFLKKDKNKNNKTEESVDLGSLPTESSLVTKAVNYIFGW